MRLNKAQRSAEGRLTGVFGDLLVRRFSVRQPEIFRVIEKVSSPGSKAALCELAQTAMDLDFDGVPGDLIHAGLARDGAVTVLEEAKRSSRTLSIHEAPYDTVSAEGDIALAHLDVGEYSAMRLLLERLAPRLAPGGHLIIDDYKSSEDCRRAVDDHFRGKKGFQLERKSRLHVIRV